MYDPTRFGFSQTILRENSELKATVLVYWRIAALGGVQQKQI
jgi:hypothetical protein